MGALEAPHSQKRSFVALWALRAGHSLLCLRHVRCSSSLLPIPSQEGGGLLRPGGHDGRHRYGTYYGFRVARHVRAAPPPLPSPGLGSASPTLGPHLELSTTGLGHLPTASAYGYAVAQRSAGLGPYSCGGPKTQIGPNGSKDSAKKKKCLFSAFNSINQQLTLSRTHNKDDLCHRE